MSDFGHSNRELLEELKSLKSRMVRLGQLGNPDVASSFAGGEEAGKAAILETALDSIISISQDGMITEFNPAAERMFGFRRAEALNRKLADLIVPDRYREAHAQGMAHFLATGIGPVLRRRIEITALRANGEEFPIELAIVPYRIADYWMFTAYIRDLTERKAMERLLELQYTVSRVLAEVSTLEEATPKILQAICDSLGWDLGQLWRVDAKAGVLRFLAACRGPATFVDHCRALTFPRDGSLPGRVWSHRRPSWIPDISRDENFPRVQVALACNLHAAFAVPVFCRDEIFGVMEFFHHEMAEPDENLLSMMAAVGRQFGQFIERKQAEDALRKSETRLAQSQKMEAIGQLAGGIAHDFNNLLTIINGYSEMILAHLDAKDPNRGSIDAIRSAGERAAALTAQLLSFSRKQLVEFKVVDLNEIIMDVQFMLRRLISEDVQLEFLLQPNLGHVKVDPGQIGQVIINLCINARDAMPTGGKLTIETKEIDLDEEFAANNPEVWPGRHVKLAITDTGTGMDEATRARIFDPFFTTKEVGKGTGLGLAVVHGIIKQCSGHISVQSEPGQGSTFRIYFPHAEKPPSVEHVHSTMEEAPRGSETILLVEDDEIVRRFTRDALTSSGYTVLEASNGGMAVRLAEEYSGAIHLLLSDVVMPGMGGRILADKISASRPDTRVLFMSGYTDDAIVRHGILESDLAFLQKPFKIANLLQKIREVLDK